MKATIDEEGRLVVPKVLRDRLGLEPGTDDEARAVPATSAALGIAGGATYDALVALAARASDLPLATRDQRAASTYAAIGVTVDVIADG